jgi:hypothetical protein
MEDKILDIIRQSLPMLIYSGVSTEKMYMMLLIPFLILLLDYAFKYLKDIYNEQTGVSLKGLQSRAYLLYSTKSPVDHKAMYFVDHMIVVQPKKFSDLDEYGKISPSANVYEYTHEKKKVYFTITERVETLKEKKEITRYLTIYSDTYDTIKQVVNNVYKEHNYYLTVKDWRPSIRTHSCIKENRGAVDYLINVYKTYENVFMSEENTRKLQTEISKFTSQVDFYKKQGIPHKRGFLLYGEPGCGKTSFILALSNELKKPIIKYQLGEASATEFKNSADNMSNSIIVFDDVDAYNFTQVRSLTKCENNNGITLDIFLDVLDGYTSFNDCIIILATNHPEKLDPAIIRPGRIDAKFYFTYATRYQLNNILLSFINKPLPENFKFDEGRHTTSFLINTIILPYHDEPDRVFELLAGLPAGPAPRGDDIHK